MRKYEFRLITMDDIPAMVDLLIYRQNLESETFPFLKNNSLNAEYITTTLQQLFADSKVIGMGAFDNNKLVGYIIGELGSDVMRGRHAWVPYEGIAMRVDQSPDLIRSLYAKVSALWIQQGCFIHYTIIPLGNHEYYEAYQRLSFAIQQVFGIMNMNDYKLFENVSDAEVRLANKNDSEIMGKMSSIIFSHQNKAPVFEPALPEVINRIKIGYEKMVEDDDTTIIIAEKDMNKLGFQAYELADLTLMTPDNGVELSISGTCGSQRGNGVGKKLMNEGYRIMKQKGYEYITADWRITNLTSSTFWPKCGFKPIAYRMVRYIDNNVAWANFDNLSIESLD